MTFDGNQKVDYAERDIDGNRDADAALDFGDLIQGDTRRKLVISLAGGDIKLCAGGRKHGLVTVMILSVVR
ncbi:hypothetical protein Aam_076_005 [Acidocella aminolytica 101 = DSM 11237]|uniref:Uncharacterized protein n=1 Tax=Acidocella aminolytica 101 = DSM 11237 TaxID=1120923 RepID=A0A0D6PH44_9PROT|nr:hypothetical protein Aam_076_005 [Acidocella aminolytica 101 = DSM 11237]